MLRLSLDSAARRDEHVRGERLAVRQNCGACGQVVLAEPGIQVSVDAEEDGHGPRADEEPGGRSSASGRDDIERLAAARELDRQNVSLLIDNETVRAATRPRHRQGI
jgi:hypothetical protein